MIFGTSIPQIWNVPNGILTFPQSVVVYNYANLGVKELVSLNGRREFFIDQYSHFQITVNLFKRSDPKADLQAILAYKNNTVLFRPHLDENVFDIPYQVAAIRPFYLETTKYFDKVSILLFSTTQTIMFKIGNYATEFGESEYGNRGW